MALYAVTVTEKETKRHAFTYYYATFEKALKDSTMIANAMTDEVLERHNISDIRKDLELMLARFEDQTDCHLAGVNTRSMSSIALQSKTAQLISINISETNKSVRTRIISESRGFYTIGIAYDSTLSEIETKIKAIIEYIGELLND